MANNSPIGALIGVIVVAFIAWHKLHASLHLERGLRDKHAGALQSYVDQGVENCKAYSFEQAFVQVYKRIIPFRALKVMFLLPFPTGTITDVVRGYRHLSFCEQSGFPKAKGSIDSLKGFRKFWRWTGLSLYIVGCTGVGLAINGALFELSVPNRIFLGLCGFITLIFFVLALLEERQAIAALRALEVLDKEAKKVSVVPIIEDACRVV